MKKRLLKWLIVLLPVIILMIILALFAFTPNKLGTKKEIKYKEVNTKDNRVTFSVDEEYVKEDKGEYDLYLSKEKKQVMGVFTYSMNEYLESSYREILDKQVQYFLNTRKDMKLFKKELREEKEDKIITRVEYSGKSDNSSECIYVFSTIEFKNDANYIVYVNQVITKNIYEKNIGEMINILESAKLN